jgi:hypothetical protein
MGTAETLRGHCRGMISGSFLGPGKSHQINSAPPNTLSSHCHPPPVSHHLLFTESSAVGYQVAGPAPCQGASEQKLLLPQRQAVPMTPSTSFLVENQVGQELDRGSVDS